VDAFAFLRDQNKRKNENIQSVCFVCSLDKTKLEKQGKNFDHHVKKEHYAWNYLFYIYYLIKKDFTNYNGIESYVAECFEKQSTSWLPIKRLLSVSSHITHDPEEIME
jgi:hypothetical protein